MNVRATPITLDRTIGVAAIAFAAVAPALVSTPVMSTYFVSVILTQVLFLGIVAASLIFLSAYGGMVSLGQAAIYGIAGFTVGNAITHNSPSGLNLGLDPWVSVLLGIGLATLIGLLFGAISSRSVGIYFLMITLTFSVLTNYFFGQVTQVSGFNGISSIHAPGIIGSVDAHPYRLYYAVLIVALAVYAVTRYIVRTPFGLSLQGIRDDPIRMSSLGYHVALHRTLAFGFAAFVASLGGVLFVWWNGHIDPASIDLSSTIDVLVMAVIGGLYRIEGAWLGALVFVAANSYLRDIGFLNTNFFQRLGLGNTRFHTYIGALFLVIILVSPGGLIGIWDRLVRLGSRRLAPVATAELEERELEAEARSVPEEL